MKSLFVFFLIYLFLFVVDFVMQTSTATMENSVEISWSPYLKHLVPLDV